MCGVCARVKCVGPGRDGRYVAAQLHHSSVPAKCYTDSRAEAVPWQDPVQGRYTHTHTNTGTHTHVHTRIHAPTIIYTHMHVCACVHTYTLYTGACTHLHTFKNTKSSLNFT